MEHLVAAAIGGLVSLLCFGWGWLAGAAPRPRPGRAAQAVGPVSFTLDEDGRSTDQAVRELEAMIRRLDRAASAPR